MKFSIIIPTLNRTKDLETALNSILELSILPYEIIIIDQSDNEETKNLCQNATYQNLSIHYHYFTKKSLTLARNFGIENINPQSDIVVFLDDDVTIQKDFLEKIEKFFDTHPHATGGVANITSPIRKIGFLKKIGFLLLTGSNKFKETFVTSGGFNVMPLIQPTNLRTIEWTSGCGMFFRKKTLDEGFRFEERFMRYSLMEDCFFSYAIQQKYPKSLYFVPDVRMTHHETPAARIANKAKIYQNIIHRFYFVQKFKKNTIAYLRTMLIFCIFDCMQYRSLRVIGYYIKGLYYVFTNKKNILQSDFDFNEFIFG